jgi:hypothetical protein
MGISPVVERSTKPDSQIQRDLRLAESGQQQGHGWRDCVLGNPEVKFKDEESRCRRPGVANQQLRTVRAEPANYLRIASGADSAVHYSVIASRKSSGMMGACGGLASLCAPVFGSQSTC